jgi:hypothetical protein
MHLYRTANDAIRKFTEFHGSFLHHEGHEEHEDSEKTSATPALPFIAYRLFVVPPRSFLP